MTEERIDALIDSLLEVDVGREEIGELVRLAAEGGETARRLAAALEAERVLRAGMDAALARAAGVSLAPETVTPARRRAGHGHRRIASLAGSWALTCVSLVVAAVAVARGPSPDEGRDLAAANPAVTEGGSEVRGVRREVLGTLPPMPVAVRPLPDGNVEVVFLRAQVEQTEVAELYRVGRDEHGRPVAVRSESMALAGRESM